MHRALLIQEVLFNIFCHAPSGVNDKSRPDLAALARTCRTFKEPALDLLWSVLRYPYPLLRCLPETGHKLTRGNVCSMSRPLERAEWDILRSYARRVRCILDIGSRFDWEFIQRTSMDFTPTEPLFPNLRFVYCRLTQRAKPLLLLPLPSLNLLSIRLFSRVDLRTLQDPLKSLAETSPNIKKFIIWCPYPLFTYPEVVSSAIYKWSNLRELHCPEIYLDADNFVHLSCMPALTKLSCMLGTTFLADTTPSGPLSFTALNFLCLRAGSLVPIPKLLSWARFPSITDFTVAIKSCPPKGNLASFMASLQVVGIGRTIQRLCLEQEPVPHATIARDPDAPLLDMEDLRPCMAFHNLLHMNIDLQWNVDLPDDKLLLLTSSWPKLEDLAINTKWGWNGPGGVTPDGLALLLQMCPSLNRIALAIDTRGYTKLPDIKCREPSTSPYEYQFQINVLDSIIEQESVDAVATFLSGVVPHVDFIFEAWGAGPMFRHPDATLYLPRWSDVYKKANEALEKRWMAQTQKSL